MRVYAFVPAKGSSERIENKNMRFLDGDRLYIRALKTLLKCKEIDKVFLDTDREEMYELADYLPITFMKRDKSLADNRTDGHKMFLNEVCCYPDADIYVQLLCTSPFIKPETIDNAINILKKDIKYDSVVLMKKDKYYFWKDNKPSYDIKHIPNSKDLPETIIESMGLYVEKKDAAYKTRRRYGIKPYLMFGSLEELIDVNNPEDLDFAEIYAKGKKSNEIQRLNLIKHFVSSSSLSDLLDDLRLSKGMKCGCVINGWKCNLDNIKVFGRANTLKLRVLKKNEDFRGIYDALNSYDGISENDVILVENECKEYAYFGDLNARLAIRAGASAAVIDGATRDLIQTKLLNFPVFAQSYNATDVRRRATTEYINKPIKIHGEVIHPGDLVFIDDCALVAIYQPFEEEIINLVLKTFINERNIINDILENKKTLEIYNQRGAF